MLLPTTAERPSRGHPEPQRVEPPAGSDERETCAEQWWLRDDERRSPGPEPAVAGLTRLTIEPSGTPGRLPAYPLL